MTDDMHATLAMQDRVHELQLGLVWLEHSIKLLERERALMDAVHAHNMKMAKLLDISRQSRP